jgi:hypothetical protein
MVNVMRKIINIFLFLGTYTPLFFILYLQNTSNIFLVLVLSSLIGRFLLIILFKKTHNNTGCEYFIIFKKNKTKYFIYNLIPYGPLVLSYKVYLFPYVEISILLCLVLLAILMIVKREVLFANPLLLLFGYKIYDIQFIDNNDMFQNATIITMHSKKDINSVFILEKLDSNIYLLNC